MRGMSLAAMVFTIVALVEAASAQQVEARDVRVRVLPKKPLQKIDTLFASAPLGLGHQDLGRPYDAKFEPIVGKEGKAVFPAAKEHHHTTVNAFSHEYVAVENSWQLLANAGGWGISARMDAAESQRHVAFRVYQITEVHEVDDTDEPRTTSAEGVWYVRRIYMGRSYEIILSGSSESFSAGIKAEFLMAGGEVEGFRRKYKLSMQVRGRGLKPKGKAIFARTPDEIEQGYEADKSEPVPIFVEFRRMPGAAGQIPAPIEWQQSDTKAPGIVTTMVSVDSTNDEWAPSGLTVMGGDVIVVFAVGQVDINGRGRMREPDAKDSYGKPDAGALQLKIGTNNYETAGSRYTTIAPADGDLKFRVLDTNYLDNQGSYTLGVMVIPKDIIPEPENALDH